MGASRGGKSFFINLVLRYLRDLAGKFEIVHHLSIIDGGKPCEDRNTIPEWMFKEGEIMDGYCKETYGNIPNKSTTEIRGVSVSGGEKPNTTGIDFWKQLFIIPDNNPNNPHKKMCILIMDTQGLWDLETNDKCNMSIFGLSCVLSSYLIFKNPQTGRE